LDRGVKGRMQSSWQPGFKASEIHLGKEGSCKPTCASTSPAFEPLPGKLSLLASWETEVIQYGEWGKRWSGIGEHG